MEYAKNLLYQVIFQNLTKATIVILLMELGKNSFYAAIIIKKLGEILKEHFIEGNTVPKTTHLYILDQIFNCKLILNQTDANFKNVILDTEQLLNGFIINNVATNSEIFLIRSILKYINYFLTK